MGFFIFWLGSIILSFGAELKYEFRMFKDIADAGYKLDFERINELKNHIDPNAAKRTVLSLFIPLYNLGVMTKKLALYPRIQPHLIDSLAILDACHEMDRYERREYEKRPTGLNAVLVFAFWEKRVGQAVIFSFESENGISQIYYEENKKTNEVTILKTSGPVSKLSYEEQIEKIEELKSSLRDDIVEKSKEVLTQNFDVEIKNDADASQEIRQFFETSSQNDEKRFLLELFDKLGEEQETRRKRVSEHEMTRKRDRKE